jgi:hypothetical protein
MELESAPLSATTPALPPKKKSWGALISLVLILALIIIGALYTWGARIEKEGPPQAPVEAQ